MRTVTELKHEFFNAYPRIYPIADSMGVTKKEIDYIFEKMNSTDFYEHDHESFELHMAGVLKRLFHLNKEFSDLEEYRHYQDGVIADELGLRHFAFVVTLFDQVYQ